MPDLTAPGTSLALQEFRLKIVTEADMPPLAVVWFTAVTPAAALAQAHRIVDALHGPADRFGELYVRDGDRAEYLDVIEPSTTTSPLRSDLTREKLP
jgi:hypothetical protein